MLGIFIIYYKLMQVIDSLNFANSNDSSPQTQKTMRRGFDLGVISKLFKLLSEGKSEKNESYFLFGFISLRQIGTSVPFWTKAL